MPSLGLVVDVMPHPVVKRLQTLFAPLALGRDIGYWPGWGAAGAAGAAAGVAALGGAAAAGSSSSSIVK